MKLTSLVAFVMAAGLLSAQTKVHLGTQSREVDFSNAANTKPMKTGATLPGTCTVGEFFFKTNEPAGYNVFACTASGVWNLQGSAVLPTVTGNAGAILSNDGVSLTWRALEGDVTGTPGVNTVGKIQNRAVSSSAPSNGNALIWNGSSNMWEPQALPGTTPGVLEVKNAGTSVGSRAAMNLIAGTGILHTVSDTGSQIDVQQAIDTAIIPTRADLQSTLSQACNSTGTSTTAYVCTMSPVLTAYTSGMTVYWRPNLDATAGAVSLEIDTLGAKAIKRADGTSDPLAGEIRSGRMYALWYDGTSFRLPANRLLAGTQTLVLARCLGGSAVAGDAVATAASGAATFDCTGGNALRGVASFANTGSPEMYVHFWLPADFSTAAGAALSVTGIAESAGAIRLRAETTCRGVAGASALPSLNTAQDSTTYTSTGATDETAVVSWNSLNLTGCAAGRQLVVKITRDNTVGSNATGAMGAFLANLIFQREIN